MSRLLELGGAVRLSVTLSDGRTNAFVQAKVYDSSMSQVSGSPFNLTHIDSGLYSSNSWTPSGVGEFFIRYEASLTSGFPIKNYDDQCETISIRDISAKIAELNTKIGTPVATVSTDIASVKADTSGLRADYTGARAIKIDNLDTTISSRATQTSVNAIPTNPLLTTDLRLNNLDATISSRSTQTSVNSIPTAVWGAARASNNTANSFGQALQGVISTTRATNLDNLDVQISTRASASNLALIPTNPLLATDARLNNIDATISSRASQASMPTANENGAAVWNTARNAATSGGSFGEALQGVISTARAAKIDNIDVAVSTRQSSTDALSQYNNLVTKVDDADGQAVG